MTSTKFVNVFKNACGYFMVGSGIIAGILGVVAAFVATFPVSIIAVAALVGGLLCAALVGYYESKQYDAEAQMKAAEALRQAVQERFYEEERQKSIALEKSLEALKGLAQDQMQLQIRLLDVLQQAAVPQVDMPVVNELKEGYTDSLNVFFQPATNDVLFESEPVAIATDQPIVIRI